MAEPDRWDPQIKHALGRVAERENRVLRVIYNASVNPLRVITIRYDQKIDALYLRLDDSKAVESEEVKPGIVVDCNAQKQVVGIEVLELKRRVPAADLEQLRLLVA